MQLLMRRPEIRGFISVSPPANMYDFSFLAPCPSSGIIIHGAGDEIVAPNAVQKLVDKLRTQRHITVHHDEIPRANHFYENEMDLLMGSVDNYLDMRLDPACPINKESYSLASRVLARLFPALSGTVQIATLANITSEAASISHTLLAQPVAPPHASTRPTTGAKRRQAFRARGSRCSHGSPHKSPWMALHKRCQIGRPLAVAF
jgi:hypothetical protein